MSQYRLLPDVSFPALLLVLALVPFSGCGTGSPDEAIPDALVRLDLGKSDPERVVRYYLGGYVSRDGGDPFVAGLAREVEGRLYVNVDSLHRFYPPSAGALGDAGADRLIDWDELEAFLEETYYDARGLPPTVDSLRAKYGLSDDSDVWFKVEVDGVMTSARRHVIVSKEALRAALRDYHANDERLIYPAGTAIVGEHYLDGRLAETTAMLKREDGFWDFVTYGETGTLAASTNTPPKPLATPTQCVGCHFGSKQFEPEASFPAEARPGPHGPRALYVDADARDAEVTAFFKEHAMRSDTVLGLYATLFIARLRADRRAGTISPEDAALLTSLGL